MVIEKLSELSAEQDVLLDQYVKKQEHGSVYHLSAWRNASYAAYGHKQIVFVAKQNNDILGVLPLSLVTSPFGKSKLVSLPYADFCGPLTDEPAIAVQLCASAQAYLATSHAKALEIRETRFVNESVLGQALLDNAMQTAKVRMLVKLPESADALLASYKPKLRSQIKKAEKNGLTAELRTDLPALQQFYTIYTRNMHRLGSPAHHFSWYKHLWESLTANQSFQIALVFFEQQPIAAGIVLTCGQQACIPWASTLNEFNHLAPNMLMYWHIQASLANQGINCFDMGRSTVGEGTFRFKQQWGAEPIQLNWREYNTHSEHAQVVANGSKGMLRSIAERTWPKLPYKYATVLGAYLRKYITL